MRSIKNVYRTAIYLRISCDDEDKAESDSILNQREMLKDYIRNHSDLIYSDEFVDDGYSGTSFDRPGFQKMLDKMQKQEIDCVVVKDLSRLGRNYIETGRYIDQIFPLLGVRFISVNDNYDSFSDYNDSDQIVIPFKNLINDAYCRDISMKVRSNLETKMKNGKYIGAFVVYGYKKDPDNHEHLIIDEEAAEIVRMVFEMKIDGYSPYKIAVKLNEMGVLTPYQYKKSKGLSCPPGYWRGDKPTWAAPTVVRILNNEMYTGTMVQGKHRKINYKVNRCRLVDKKDWVRVSGTHEPIVPKTVYDRVQELLELDTRTPPGEETVGLFAGFLKCCSCGQNMVCRIRYKGEKKYVYYMCSTASSHGGCSYHPINSDRVEEAVLQAVQLQMKLLLSVKDLLESVDTTALGSYRIKVLGDQIKALENEIARYQERKERLYEDYSDSLIDKDDFEELKQRMTNRINHLTRSLDALKRKVKDLRNTPVIPPDWLDEISNYGAVTKLTRRMVVMLIDRIVIHDKKRVEVVFRYQDEIRFLTELAADASGYKKGMVAV